MAHAQKPDFVFLRNGRVHLNRWGGGGGSVQSTAGSRGACISGSDVWYTMFRGSANGILATHSIRQFPLQFPSRASPCAVTFQLDSTKQSLSISYEFRAYDGHDGLVVLTTTVKLWSVITMADGRKYNKPNIYHLPRSNILPQTQFCKIMKLLKNLPLYYLLH